MKIRMLNPKSLAQTWLTSLLLCSKHIAYYRPSGLIRVYSARAGRYKFSIFKIQMTKTEYTTRDITSDLNFVF